MKTEITEEHQYPETVNLCDLERLIEAYEKSREQVLEILSMMQTAAMIAMEPLKDRIEALEAKYNLRPARIEPVAIQEEETTDD